MKTKKLLSVVAILVLLLAALPVLSVGAGAVKVDVCHSEGNGTYHLINVSENAYDSHVAHGDASPGEPVPGMEGYEFDEACVPVEAVETILVVGGAAYPNNVGWFGWSCPSTHPYVVDGGVSTTATEPLVDATMVNFVLAKPGASLDGYTYPNFPHYNYPGGEQGIAVHNAGAVGPLYPYIYCSE